jgi:hypothetical protein
MINKMAISDNKIFNKSIQDDFQLNYDREIYLMNNNDKFVCDWIAELTNKIKHLEESNKALHAKCNTGAFNQTQG